ncbi:hypothetical protein CCP3SC15_500013 [Gammaproteobacteria bacterium]
MTFSFSQSRMRLGSHLPTFGTALRSINLAAAANHGRGESVRIAQVPNLVQPLMR